MASSRCHRPLVCDGGCCTGNCQLKFGCNRAPIASISAEILGGTNMGANEAQNVAGSARLRSLRERRYRDAENSLFTQRELESG